MHPTIKCPTCGCLIGHLYRLFQAMRAMKAEGREDLMDIFKLLSVHSYCCKTRLLTTRQFNDFLRE